MRKRKDKKQNIIKRMKCLLLVLLAFLLFSVLAGRQIAIDLQLNNGTYVSIDVI